MKTVVRLWKLWRKGKKQIMLQKSNKIKFNPRRILVCPVWHKIVHKIDHEIVPKIAVKLSGGYPTLLKSKVDFAASRQYNKNYIWAYEATLHC